MFYFAAAVAVYKQGFVAVERLSQVLINIHDSQAKVIAGVVMICCSRKIAVGCADTCSGCSAGHCGFIINPPSLWGGGFIKFMRQFPEAIVC